MGLPDATPHKHPRQHGEPSAVPGQPCDIHNRRLRAHPRASTSSTDHSPMPDNCDQREEPTPSANHASLIGSMGSTLLDTGPGRPIEAMAGGLKLGIRASTSALAEAIESQRCHGRTWRPRQGVRPGTGTLRLRPGRARPVNGARGMEDLPRMSRLLASGQGEPGPPSSVTIRGHHARTEGRGLLSACGQLVDADHHARRDQDGENCRSHNH